MTPTKPVVAIVDYGMGNLYSVQHACRHVGLSTLITSDPREIRAADAIILPGIGAMPDAIAVLRATHMDDAIRRSAADGRPLFGICLGMQLLMSEGTEFGRHEGLDLIAGTVQRFDHPTENGRPLRVPAIGWNGVFPAGGDSATGHVWARTPLEHTAPGEHFYFVHSYCVVPTDAAVVLATTAYGSVRYASVIASGAIFACQFHPERSGPQGLTVYRRFAAMVN